MPARPVEISRIVPGSGTGVGGGRDGGGGCSPGEQISLVGSHPPDVIGGGPDGIGGRPDGIGGGKMAGKPPPPPGPKSGEPGGPCGSNGTSSRLNSADSKLPGNENRLAAPLASKGSSNVSAGGSSAETAFCGVAETWLAQRVRALITPSVTSFSPFRRCTFFFVQKTLFPIR